MKIKKSSEMKLEPPKIDTRAIEIYINPTKRVLVLVAKT